MDDVKAGLENLGLSDKEVAVYIALLQLGDASAYGIANKSGLKKPTTYVILDELRRKGFVKKIPRSKKWLFRAEPPEEVITLAEERIGLLRRTLPKLRSLVRGDATKASTLYFEGVRGVKQLLDYRQKEMAGKEILGFYAIAPDDKELNEHFDKWNETSLKHNIKTRGIVPDHPNLERFRTTDKAFGREMKVVPKDLFTSEVAIDILDSTVRIHDYKNLQGIAIENADIAKTMREIFEMVWAKY